MTSALLRTVLAVALAFGIGCGQRPADLPEIPAPAREFRAAWVATVANIDWPSRPGLPVAKQREELDAIFDAAVSLRLNAIVFQVRPACDALYRSKLEPWAEWLSGEQGKAPGENWDPLDHAIAAARARGLELHAWINPFRARHRGAKSEVVDSHSARSFMVPYGDELWLDPGFAEAREHTIKVVADLLRRYELDGIHIDDYFYPYPIQGKEFPDGPSYQRYQKGGGKLDRKAWRRSNVDRMVESMHKTIRTTRPHARFGISPFGIVRPGIPEGIKAGIDQYDDLYADVALWLRNGWCDYIVPQLYWPIAQTAQSYPVLQKWWCDNTPANMHLFIGNYTSRAAGGGKGWSTDELLAQIELTRRSGKALGNVHFSMKALRDDVGSVRKRLREGLYERAALPPTWPWLDASAPARPSIRVKEVDGALEIRWSEVEDARAHPVYLLCDDEWLLIEVVAAKKPGLLVTKEQREKLAVSAVAVSSLDDTGNESARAVHSLR
jgi:uncharacterized lipoprotein YddW (UPF0748 family)